MTEYEVAMGELDLDWQVSSIDDNGEFHLTIFRGPIAEARARVYADRMNEIHAKVITFPGD